MARLGAFNSETGFPPTTIRTTFDEFTRVPTRSFSFWKWALLVAVILLSVAIGWTVNFLSPQRICQGVHVLGVDLGGLTTQEAEQKASELAESAMAQKLVLKYEVRQWEALPSKLGAEPEVSKAVREAHQVGRQGWWGRQLITRLSVARKGKVIPMTYKVYTSTLHQFLRQLAGDAEREPVDAAAEPVNSSMENAQDKRVTIFADKLGLKIDAAATAKKISQALAMGNRDPVEIVMSQQPPQITRAMLASVNCVLSSYSTRFNPGKVARTHNLGLACGFLDGTLLQPGETFSYNQVVGPRLEKNGYLAAPIFRDNEIVPEVGGGVCQVASTLYNSALLANLKVIQRSHHSRTVDYVPTGQDATVYYGNKDLRFINTTSSPIYIRARVIGNYVSMHILGNARDQVEVKLLRQGVGTTRAEVVKQPDPELPAGEEEVVDKGCNGHRVTLLREVKLPDGSTKMQTISRDVYKAFPKIIHVGNTTPTPEQKQPNAPALQSVPSQSNLEEN